MQRLIPSKSVLQRFNRWVALLLIGNICVLQVAGLNTDLHEWLHAQSHECESHHEKKDPSQGTHGENHVCSVVILGQGFISLETSDLPQKQDRLLSDNLLDYQSPSISRKEIKISARDPPILSS